MKWLITGIETHVEKVNSIIGQVNGFLATQKKKSEQDVNEDLDGIFTDEELSPIPLIQ